MNDLTNYVGLAAGYAGFLAALGGVSITILTLVLTMRRSSRKVRLYPTLVAALVVATMACFVGTHLMAETAALVQAVPPQTEGFSFAGTRRHFSLGAVNIYVASTLFVFALLLLPRVYDNDIPRGLQEMAFVQFILVGVGAYAWMVVFALTMARSSYAIVTIGSIIGLFLALFPAIAGYYKRETANDKEGMTLYPFYLCLLVIFLSQLRFACTYNGNYGPTAIDLCIYVSSVTVASASITGLALKEYTSERMWRPQPRRSGRPTSGH